MILLLNIFSLTYLIELFFFFGINLELILNFIFLKLYILSIFIINI